MPADLSKPVTVPGFIQAKRDGRKLTMLTAYEYLWASLFDEAGVDALLVGDTLGMVVQGKSTTLPVTLDEMIYHGEIVARAVKRALVVVDLPFLTFQVSPQQAVENAGRVLKETQASAVKLEGEKSGEYDRTVERGRYPGDGTCGPEASVGSQTGSHGDCSTG